MTDKTRPLKGIIQTRGLGDVVIALPIAYHYYEQGYQPVWPILSHWVEQMRAVAPWCEWLSVEQDQGQFFYDRPMSMLKARGCVESEVVCFYNALTNHKFHEHAAFQHVKFDQFKYAQAGVAFERKWDLAKIITRHPAREQALKDRILGGDSRPYVVTHLSSSEHTVNLPQGLIPPEYRQVPISTEGWIWDWISILEGSEAVVMVDSVFANMVDQLRIPVERYFLPLHHIQLTPVFGQPWYWLTNAQLDPRTRIFHPS